MNFIWNTTQPANWIISLAVILVVFVLILLSMLKVIRRTAPYIILAVGFALEIICFLFTLIYPFIIIAAFFTFFFTVSATINIGDLNKFLANPFKKIKTKTTNFGVEKIYDHDDFNKRIETAVLNLSKNKIGAIITFEKNKSLKNFYKNGVMVNAPVTPELLSTIFYPGTRLHDGAVVIHGNQIVCAAVFYTLTTQPFAVKYGSRHRAAIGISEVSDAVTVVVSEETGRIAFAVNGQLEPVDSDNFLRVFDTYMSDVDDDVTSEEKTD